MHYFSLGESFALFAMCIVKDGMKKRGWIKYQVWPHARSPHRITGDARTGSAALYVHPRREGGDLARGGEASLAFFGKNRECISIHPPFPFSVPVSLVSHLPINRVCFPPWSSLCAFASCRLASARKLRKSRGNVPEMQSLLNALTRNVCAATGYREVSPPLNDLSRSKSSSRVDLQRRKNFDSLETRER